MSPIDLVIVALVAVLMLLAIRSLRRSRGECAGCGKSGGCSAHVTGHGECPAAASVVSDLERGIKDSVGQ